MQKYTQEDIKTVVEENERAASELSVQMVKLEVIQGAIAKLMTRLDEITYKDWEKNANIARMSIYEIQDTVRLIDMAFHPLFKAMSEEVKDLSIHSGELYEILIKGKEKADAPTSTNEK